MILLFYKTLSVLVEATALALSFVVWLFARFLFRGFSFPGLLFPGLLFLGMAPGAVPRAAAESDLSLAPFPQARVVYHSDIESDDYILTLGALEKVDGVWRAEKEQRLKGNLHRETLEIPEDYSAKEGFEHFAGQLRKLSSRELFRCRGRGCGSSSSWAANRFKVRQLYGLDQEQHYGAYEILGPQKELYFVALYAVRRGNKRIYVQLEILRAKDENEERIAANYKSIAEQLKSQGFYVLPGFAVGSEGPQLDPLHRQVLVQALKRERRLNVAVVGHDYGQGDLDRRRANSQAYADYVKAQLVEAGIEAARVNAFGVGSLAPGRRGDRSLRVEVVRVD